VDILNACTPHPAYPSPADVRRHRVAARIEEAAFQNNRCIHQILDEAARRLNSECDLGGHSMVPGMDLSDIHDTILSMQPQFNAERVAKLRDYAKDQAEGVS
jgi:hypothetical protein